MSHIRREAITDSRPAFRFENFELAKRDELLGLLACFRDFPLEIPLAHCVRGGMVRTIM
ncbi:MAG: hypothetical protein SPL42_05400 [Bacteroidales bacterium]|nr:hypothetical protein [Bacteroidales bacterium]MDY6347850.1 hypothetical protein [Bacteroidales bacterium]